MSEKENFNEWSLPVAFYFRVKFLEDSIPDTDFSEVSGILSELELEPLKEGGVNNFAYQLPTRVKHNNLILKRALQPLSNGLETWVKKNIDEGISNGFTPLDIAVSLMDHSGNIIHQWLCGNAYPVKWEISPLGGNKNEIVIETLELNYNILSRSL